MWDGISDARIIFTAPELELVVDQGKTRPMAWLTENPNLQRAFLLHLATVPEVRLLDKVKVSSIERDGREGGGGYPLVNLSDGRRLRARLLVSGMEVLLSSL